MSQTVLITGANRGIGLELVKQYAGSDCKVLACCREPAKALELKKLANVNSKITLFPLDVVVLDQINQLAQQLKHEAIDILFNNAAVGDDDTPFGAVKYEHLLETLKINSIAPIMVAQAFLPHVAKSKNKLIVNISSTLGSIQLCEGDWFSYSVSKSALNSATRRMAQQLEEKGIIVVSIHPGWVRTDMGSQNADISTEQSVRGMKNVLNKITLADSGSFLAFDGRVIPW